jgi:hypothetical protein
MEENMKREFLPPFAHRKSKTSRKPVDGIVVKKRSTV